MIDRWASASSELLRPRPLHTCSPNTNTFKCAHLTKTPRSYYRHTEARVYMCKCSPSTRRVQKKPPCLPIDPLMLINACVKSCCFTQRRTPATGATGGTRPHGTQLICGCLASGQLSVCGHLCLPKPPTHIHTQSHALTFDLGVIKSSEQSGNRP